MTVPFPPPPPARRTAPVRAMRYCIVLSGLLLRELHQLAEEEGRTAEEVLYDAILRWLLRRSRRRARQRQGREA